MCRGREGGAAWGGGEREVQFQRFFPVLIVSTTQPINNSDYQQGCPSFSIENKFPAKQI